MFSKPNRSEIDDHTMKLIIGIIALSLASLTSFLSGGDIQSISASYYADGWARNVFVGFLFAISAFLLAYNGRSFIQMVCSKIAAISAIGVAMFPCNCGGYPEIIAGVHGGSAAVMFLILAFFCFIFFQRARTKVSPQAKARAAIYALCGIVMVLSIMTLLVDYLSGGAIRVKIDRLTFFGEAAGLISFGVAWLTASRTLPIVTGKGERISLSPFTQ